MFQFPRQRLWRNLLRSLVLGFLLAQAFGPWNRHLLPEAHAQLAPPAEDISAVLVSIERAWSEGDADALVARFGSRKVLLRLPDNLQSSRRFSRQQSLLILRDHFLANEIRRFSVVQTQVPEAERGKAMGLADVVWRRRGVGRTKEGRILMVMEFEGNRWVLTEVLALP